MGSRTGLYPSGERAETALRAGGSTLRGRERGRAGGRGHRAARRPQRDGDYKRHLARVLTKRALTTAAEGTFALPRV